MLISILRSIGSVIAGLVVALALIIAVEIFGTIFHPFPPGVDSSDYEACKAHVARFPTWVLAVAAAGWAGTVFVSAWLATRLGTARHPAHGIVVGAILLAFAGLNMAMLPYPIWFPIVNFLSFPLGTFWSARLGRGAAQSRRDSTP